MDKLGIAKDAAASAVPFAPKQPSAKAAGAVKNLTVKLDDADYWRLRDYCAAAERATGARVTHQQIMVQALRALLAGQTC